MFEIELIICIKMDLALNNIQGWYAIKPNQPENPSQPLLSLLIPMTDTLTQVKICIGKFKTQDMVKPSDNIHICQLCTSSTYWLFLEQYIHSFTMEYSCAL